MDELERVISRAASFEAEQSQAAGLDESGQTSVNSGSGTIQKTDDLEAAKKMAESLLKATEKAVRAFIDNRLECDAAEVEDCRESVGPLLHKYGMTTGDGKIPYQEEIYGGFYLGGLWKRFRKTLAQLRAADKKKAEQQSNGNQRKHETTSQARALPSNDRVREKPDATSEGWDSEDWSAGSAVGHKQGSSGA